MQRIMVALYNEDACEYDAFMAWKEDMSPAVRQQAAVALPCVRPMRTGGVDTCRVAQNEAGKMKCILGTSKFFNHLADQAAEEEEEEEEESDED
jgi:hypothetical protein